MVAHQLLMNAAARTFGVAGLASCLEFDGGVKARLGLPLIMVALRSTLMITPCVALFYLSFRLLDLLSDPLA